MAAKRFDVACAKFRESNRLRPRRSGALFNLANCEAQRGQLVTSWTLYRQVLEKLPPDDARTSVAKVQVQSLDARIPRLTIRARGEMPAATVVTVAGLSLSPASLDSPLPLNPGRYAISVFSPGRSKQEFSVALAEGDAAQFPVFVGVSTSPLAKPRSLPAPSRCPHSESAGSDDDDRNNRELLAYAGIGVGAVGFTLGLITGLVGLHQESDIGNATRLVTLLDQALDES